ncbi:MAG: hypothetical protein M3373_13770 [Gemmatimonadota bacterium]|nr:hypothetical protein [Gemmatimonadota bacterium]
MSRRPGGPWIVSLALHAVLGAGLVYVVGRPGSFEEWWRSQKSPPKVVERIGFVSVPQGPIDTPGRSGGDDRPVTAPQAPPPPLVAPTETPAGVPMPVPLPITPEAGAGRVVGEGGPTQGINPSYRDPRLWIAPERGVVTAPAPGKQTPEEIGREIGRRLEVLNDSIALARSGRKPGDWTVERDGKKYGLDQNHIYIGSVKLPAALLALLPINRQANPAALDRERALSSMSADIRFHAQRAATEDEFKAAVKRIRERKERERRAAEQLAKNAQAP